MKTSIWLDDETGAEWKATGLPLAELVKRGLEAGQPEPLDDKIRRIIREEIADLPVADTMKRIVRDEINRATGHA